MLQITIEGQELWNEELEIYEYSKTTHLNLEHSLVSISKWESKWHKPFFSRLKHTEEETRDYIRCMTIDRGVDPDVYKFMSKKNIKAIMDYINDPMSAMVTSNEAGVMREVITSEKIYSWMFSYNIPKECEKWHISRLMNVIDLLNEANTPSKHKKYKDPTRSWSKINAQRRAAMHSKG